MARAWRTEWLFFEKIRDFVENGARVTDGILQIEQSELEKRGQSASERAIRERVELGVVVCEVRREGFVVRVPDFRVETLGKLQNLRGDGLAAVRERGRAVFLGAVVQLGVVLAFPEGEQEREGECKQEKPSHPGNASGCMLYTPPLNS